MAASMLGQTLGRYRLTEELGRGGMATVYRAEDTTLGRSVAIKVLHTFLVDSGEVKQRFLREARAIAALRHPNIVEVFDFQAGDADTPPHLVTELVRGPALSRFVAERGFPLPEVAALIVLKVAEGLAVAHRAGIVHRDVKPENVLIDLGGDGQEPSPSTGRVVLSDFGIARMAGEGTMTKTGALVGSPAFMSPEQARSDEVDARSDVFSLGTTLYHLAAGKLPFAGKNPLTIITAILEGRYEPAVRANPRVPGALEQIIDRCLRRDPAQRYANAAELAAALRALCADAGLSDPDAELRAYFKAPGEYNAALVPKLVGGALRVAREAVEKGEAARALRACDRVLSLEPGNPEARALLATLSARSRLLRVAVAVGALIVIAVGGFVLSRHRTAAVPAAAPLSAPAPAAVPAAVPAPAAAAAAAPVPAPAPAPDAAALPEPKRPARPRRVAATAAPAPTAPVPLPAMDAASAAPAPPAPAHLTVRAIPYCQPLLLDGRALARPYALDTTPGPHKLRCVHPQGTRELQVTLVPGPNPEVVVRVFDDALVDANGLGGELLVDGRRCAPSCRVPVGSVALELRVQGRLVESKPMFDLPPGTCHLLAGPLRCRAAP